MVLLKQDAKNTKNIMSLINGISDPIDNIDIGCKINKYPRNKRHCEWEYDEYEKDLTWVYVKNSKGCCNVSLISHFDYFFLLCVGNFLWVYQKFTEIGRRRVKGRVKRSLYTGGGSKKNKYLMLIINNIRKMYFYR